MELSPTVIDYLEKHPLESDRKITRLFKVKRQDILVYRQSHRHLFFDCLFTKTGSLLNRFYLSGKFIFLNLFLMSVLVRLIYFFSLKKNEALTIPILDAEYYLDWAKRIHEGGLIGDKIFFTEPLYAYLLAITGQSVMIFFQILLGLLLPFVIFTLARRIFNYPVAVLSGFITALYGPFLFYENLILKTSLETFLLSSFGLVLMISSSKPGKVRFFFTGLLLGILVLTKGNALIFLPLLPILRRKRTLIVCYILGFSLVILPVTVRNYIVGRDLVFTNYSFGMNIYQGNWWDSDGSLLQPPFIRPHPKYEETDSYKMAEAYQNKSLKPSQVSSFWLRKALVEIGENPLRWLQLMMKKTILFITHIEMSDNYDYSYYKNTLPILNYLPDFWLIMPFSLAGILITLFNRQRTASQKYLLACIVGYSFVVLAGHVNSRYRIPVIPLLIIFASLTLHHLFTQLRQHRFSKLLLTSLMVTIFLFLGSLHLDNYDFITDANFYNNLGTYYQNRRLYPKALSYFEKAIATNSKYYFAYNNLYALYLINGEPTLAKENLDKAIALRSDDAGIYKRLELFYQIKDKPLSFIVNRFRLEEEKGDADPGKYDPSFYEGMRALKQNNTTLAIELLTTSAKQFNNPSVTLLNLAVLYKNEGNLTEAKTLLNTIIEKDKYFLAANYNLANIYLKEKDYAKAASLLQSVYDLVPEYGETWYYLATTYINIQENETALPLVNGFIKKYENDPEKRTQVDKFKSMLVGKTE